MVILFLINGMANSAIQFSLSSLKYFAVWGRINCLQTTFTFIFPSISRDASFVRGEFQASARLQIRRIALNAFDRCGSMEAQRRQ
jgi:hypothetical protein